MLHDLFSAARDRQTVKEVAVINSFAFFGNLVLKKAPDHKLIECLAETTRTGKQYHLCIAFQQFLYHQGLVDKISVFIYNLLEVLHPDGDFFPLFGITHSLTLLSLHTASHFPRAAFFAQLLLLYVIVYWNPPKETSEKQKSAPFDSTDFRREASFPGTAADAPLQRQTSARYVLFLSNVPAAATRSTSQDLRFGCFLQCGAICSRKSLLPRSRWTRQ